MEKDSINNKPLDFLSMLPDLVNIFLVVLDRDGRIVFVNRKACEILGHAQEKVEGLDWFKEFIPEEQQQEVRQVFDRLMAVEIEEVREHTNRIIAAGKQIRLMNWHNTYMRNSRGMIQGTVSAGTDITDMKAMKDELYGTENRLRSIFRAVPAGIGLVLNRILMEVNDMICSMSGYSREELLGQSARILYPNQEEFEFVGKSKYAQIADRGIGTVTTKWKKKSGEIIDILLSSVPLDPADLEKGVTFSALDISDLKQSHIALQREIELVTRIAETSPVGIMQINAEGFIVFANRRAEEMSGKIRDELMGCFLGDAFHFVSDSMGNNLKGDFFSLEYLSSMKSPVYGRQFTVRRADNEEMTIMINITPLLSEDSIFTGCMVAIEDISERRRLENELMRTEKLESLGILAGGIAHDFRNLMEGIFGSIEMARISGHLDEK
ncbi:MAG: PAS domain-containing sensor histidine kinase, partial [Spirochaetaceae bacterium]